MRVLCPYCHKAARITHSVPISKTANDLYVNCQNIDCAARVVIWQSHSSTITPPLVTQTAALHEWFANQPEDVQKSIARQYQPALF